MTADWIPTWHRASHDIDQQCELLPDWPQAYVQLERGLLDSEVDGAALEGAVGLFRKRTSRRLYKRFCTPQDTLAVAVLGPGSEAIQFQGEAAAAGQALLLPPGHSFDIVCHGGFDVSVATIDADRVRAWVGDASAFDPAVLARGPALVQLDGVMDTLLAHAARGAEWMLEDRLLSVLTALPPSRRAPVGSAAAFEQARRLMLERAQASGEAPLLGDVARDLGVSARWLHEIFRQRSGMAPSQFMQRLRLAQARAELRRPKGQETSVSDVAMKWGFPHLGRFAGTYRRTFGELPSQTLRVGMAAA